MSPTVALETAVSPNSCSNTHKQTYCLTFISTVLSLRGSSIVKQPLSNPKSGCLLSWNGEVWSIGNQWIQGNDAEYLFDYFLDAANRHRDNVEHTIASRDQSLHCLIDMLSSITGPYAFVFYDAQHHRVFYGRDPLGRRSLLIRRHSTGGFMLSSISDCTEPEGWVEVEADGIYVLDLTADIDLSGDVDPVTYVPWVTDHSKSSLTRTLVPYISLLLILMSKS